MKARRFRFWFNLWPPVLGAGIAITELSPDYRRVAVALHAHWWNRNYVGTHYGGSLYSMTDPFYMLLLMHNLGRDYIVWDKAASIRFRKPGRGTLRAVFTVDAAELTAIRTLTAREGKCDRTYECQVLDAAGEVVAEVVKTVYVRRKDTPERAGAA